MRRRRVPACAMTVLFGTLGFTPKKLLPSVPKHDGVTKLVFFHDRAGTSRDAAAKVRAFCRDRGLDVEGVELDAFDIVESALAMRARVRREGADRVVFNVTGGTPVLSSAATLTCILEGVRAVYIDERDGEEVPLPLLTMRYGDVLNPEQRRVLEVVARHADGCTQAQIGKATGLSKATVSHHVTNLKAKRLLAAAPDPTDARRETLRVQASAALLLGDA